MHKLTERERENLLRCHAHVGWIHQHHRNDNALAFSIEAQKTYSVNEHSTYNYTYL